MFPVLRQRLENLSGVSNLTLYLSKIQPFMFPYSSHDQWSVWSSKAFNSCGNDGHFWFQNNSLTVERLLTPQRRPEALEFSLDHDVNRLRTSLGIRRTLGKPEDSKLEPPFGDLINCNGWRWLFVFRMETVGRGGIFWQVYCVYCAMVVGRCNCKDIYRTVIYGTLSIHWRVCSNGSLDMQSALLREIGNIRLRVKSRRVWNGATMCIIYHYFLLRDIIDRCQ